MSDTPFKYLSGDPSLDLVNTIDWTSRGPEQDRITGYDRLIEWAEGAGVLGHRTAARLLQSARQHPRKAVEAVGRARQARDSLHRLFLAVAGYRSAGTEFQELNGLLEEAHRHARLEPAAPSAAPAASWTWDTESLTAPLWPVVRRAADLLASDEAARIHVCGGPDCGWMYVDRSRNGLRRWCEMETCGTREKTRRRRSGRPPSSRGSAATEGSAMPPSRQAESADSADSAD